MRKRRGAVRSGMCVMGSVGLALCWVVLTGCQTPGDSVAGKNTVVSASDEFIPLSEEQRDFARALAYFSRAQVHEFRREFDQALEFYQQALAYDPEHTGTYLRVAINLMRGDRDEEAIDLLQELVERRPDQADPLIWLGSAYRQKEDWEAALRSYRGALERDPENEALYMQMTGILIQQERKEEAIDLLQEGAEIVEHPSSLYQLLGELYLQEAATTAMPDESQELREKAITTLKKGLDDAPRDTRILRRLGDLHMHKNEYEKAIDYFERLHKIDPTDIEADQRLATACERAGRLEEAVEVLNRISVRQPTNDRLFFSMGMLYERLEKIDEAVHNYQMAVRLGRSNPDAYLRLAGLLLQKEPEKALTALREGLKKMPHHPRLLEMKGYVHSFKENHAKAIERFKEVEERVAGTDEEESVLNARFYFWYAAAHEREELYDRAEELFYKCLELDPDNAEAYNYLAYMWAELGINLEQAKEYVLIALEERPDSAAFIDTLGWIYYQKGRYEEAYKEIQRAAEIIPDDPTILDHLGDIYLKLDNVEQAKAYWEKVLLLEPDNEDVAEKLMEHEVDLDPLREKAEKKQDAATPDEDENEKKSDPLEILSDDTSASPE